MPHLQSTSPGLQVSWPLGLEPLVTQAECFTEPDDDFSVSWLLGLQAAGRPRPRWAYQYETTDERFRVSWLLGLEAKPQAYAPPTWAKQYQTMDEDFRVSWLLGLEPSALCEATAYNVEDDALDPLTLLAPLFGEAPYPWAEDSGEDGGNEEDKETEDNGEKSEDDSEEEEEETPEQRKQRLDYLEVATALEGLLDEIEARAESEGSESGEDDDNESIDGLGADDCTDEDVSRLEWCRQKKVEFAENPHIERLMSLPGLADVKKFFLQAKAKFMAADRRDTVLKKTNFNVIFRGNQGTGKSMVSLLYAKYLVSMGFVRPSPGFNGIYKALGFTLGHDGVSYVLDGIKDMAMNCGGCVVIIEDAHHIEHRHWNLWRLYRAIRELKGNFAFILNSEAEGLGEVMATNAQLPAELPTLTLNNYTTSELRTAFEGLLRVHFNKKMTVEGGTDGPIMDILLKRVQRSGSGKSFSNMWALRKAFIDACKRQFERFKEARSIGEYPEDFQMTRNDLLGSKPDMSLEKSPAWKELQDLVGLDGVKEAILSVVHQVSDNMDRELRGDEMLPISANRVFLGSPGTGKTTVAKLYARILADFGILSKGEVVVKNSTDLIDRYIGGSENNTKDALETANGSVLIIDDAHMLDPGKDSCSDKNGDFRGGILDTLVAEVAGQPGEDRCIILCGYEGAMEDMYQNGNPGLARRFPLDTAFRFPDFSPDVLGRILDIKTEKQKVPISAKAREVAMEMLKRASVRPNFGNGGEVDNILAKGNMARTKRLMAKAAAGEKDCDKLPLEPEDFDPDWARFSRAAANTRELFKGFIGFEDIIAKFESYQLIAQGMRLRNLDPRPYIPFTYVFKGPPGTGKTSTARKLGQIFYDMGFLSAPDVVEVSASQMIGEYLGQTAPKTRRLLESALGKVLFIDEAYRLAERGCFGNSYAEEAVGELVDAVTKEKFRNKLIIVLAGYEEDMDRLMRVNQGMRSRFATELEFKPMRGEQCLDQLRRHVSGVGIEVQATTAMDTATRNDLLGSLSRMTREKDWASGRSVETLGDRLIGHVFKECALKGYTGAELKVTGRDVMRILGLGGLKNGVALRAGGRSGFGASQVMTLKDLGGYE